MEDAEVEVFRRSLSETIAWCSEVGDPEDPSRSLRTPALQPSKEFPPLETSGRDGLVTAAPDDRNGSPPVLWLEEEDERATMVSSVADRRVRALSAQGISCPGSPLNLAGGHLLFYFPDLTNHNGLTEFETSGYFDLFDTPPWDTRIVFRREPHPPPGLALLSYVVSWVPPGFLGIAQRGVECEAMGCLLWAYDVRYAWPEAEIPVWLEQYWESDSQSASWRPASPRSRLPEFPLKGREKKLELLRILGLGDFTR